MGEKKVCPKCGSGMETGELLDKDYDVEHPQYWANEDSIVPGSDIKEKKRIISYRCIRCGYLENYAP
jgi:predicted nucleic-acid-binding Zn-ribbon protein